MKDMKVTTKLTIGFIIIDILMIISLYTGYSTASSIINRENPENFLHSFAIFTCIEFIVMVIIMTTISISITRTIRVSLANVSAAVKKIAEGNVDVKLEKSSNNEFGMLIDEFKLVVDNIRYQSEVAGKVADGDLCVEVVPKSDKDLLGQSLKRMVSYNNQVLGNIKDSAYQVTTSSSQVASASEALAQGSTEQASAIEQITASINDITEKTKQNAEKANEVAGLMADAIVNVKQGNEQMQEMTVAMQEINDSSESISKIIKVIDDIAFQTNILALNAAVEAARAGEAGKGFAVVAEEVRNLAAKSAAAASETAELIEDSIDKVEAGSNIAKETAKALESITEVVKQSEGLIIGIAEESNYQATAIAQIDQAVEQVSQVVQNNSATSEECAAASMELSNQASRMREMLAIYKLTGNSNMGNPLSQRTNSYKSISEKNEQIISLGGGFGKY